jgi:hypothetical protein
MHDHVTLLSPARIERGIARDNFTPILSRTRSSGFNVFGLRMGLRSTGLKASEHGGSDARAAGRRSRSGVPYRHPPNLPGSTSFVLRFRSPAHLHFGQVSANFLRPDVLPQSREEAAAKLQKAMFASRRSGFGSSLVANTENTVTDQPRHNSEKDG